MFMSSEWCFALNLLGGLCGTSVALSLSSYFVCVGCLN